MLYQKKNNALEPLTGSTLYAETPIGTVIASFLAVAPSGYIKADGTVYTKAQYPELYERIPDVFKDTTNETFTIDLREVALKGIGLSSLTSNHYSNTGLTLGKFIEDRVQQHKHQLGADGSSSYPIYWYNPGAVTRNARTVTFTNSDSTVIGVGNMSTGRAGATTEVKSVGVNYFVKAKHVALPIDIMDAISEEYATKEYVDNRRVDYAHPVTEGKSGNTFTAPVDCVVNYGGIWFRASSESDLSKLTGAYIRINGSKAFTMDRSGGSTTGNMYVLSLSMTVFLKAGDILTAFYSDNTSWTQAITGLTIYPIVNS